MTGARKPTTPRRLPIVTNECPMNRKLLLDKLKQTGLLVHGSTGVLAVSGGADSMALLHGLCALRQHYAIQLYVATYDHGLRGAESAADAALVAEQCQAWGVPYHVGRADGLLSPHAAGLEARARAARYTFLAGVVRRFDADWLMTAHHADDQAETVLMNVLRGAGVHGVGGMRPRAPIPFAGDELADVPLLRPLLEVRKADLMAYCQAEHIPYRHDSTNDDLHHRRNWARHVALPMLAQANPDVTGALGRLAAAAALDESLLESLVQPVCEAVRVTTAGASIARGMLTDIHPALRVRVVARMCERLGPTDEPPSFVHLRGVANLLDGPTGGALELPGGLHARLEHDALLITREGMPPDRPPLVWMADGETVVLPAGQWTALSCGAQVRCGPLADGDSPPALVFYVGGGQVVTLRPPRSGERVRPLGLHGHSTPLKKWLIDQRVPQRWRAALPIVAVDEMPMALWDGQRWVRFYAPAREDYGLWLRPAP